MTQADGLAIVARHLSRSFGTVQAVSGVDLEVGKGRMHGLIGPDGAGKTTVIRILCGLLKPTGGSAEVLGHDLTRDRMAIMKRIGYLSQRFTLYGDLTVDENIEFFAEIHGVGEFRRRRDELLDFMRLTPFRGRLAEFLSGGMRKKLALACTLIHTPDLIFLDEPSTGVDPVSRGEFWNILTTVVEQGVTVFLTTPYLDEADRCDRISLICAGRVISNGSPGEVKQTMPGEMYDLTCPAAREAYRRLRERWSAARVVLMGDRIHFRTNRGVEEVKEASELIDRRGLGPAQFQKVEPSLEDVFVALAESHSTEEHRYESAKTKT